MRFSALAALSVVLLLVSALLFARLRSLEPPQSVYVPGVDTGAGASTAATAAAAAAVAADTVDVTDVDDYSNAPLARALQAGTAAWLAWLGMPPSAGLDSEAVVPIHRESIDGVDAVWVRPAHPRVPARLLLLLHGCNHRAISFMRYGEHRAFTAAAVARGWAVLALSSASGAAGSAGGCWDTSYPPGSNADVSAVSGAVAAFMQRRRWKPDAVPVSAFGVSSGGAFVTLLVAGRRGVRLASVAVVIAGGHPQALATAGAMWPPTLFVHMARDGTIAHAVANGVATLRQQGATASELACYPRPLTSTTLARRLGVSGVPSERFFLTGRQQGWLNGTGFVVEDGRSSRATWLPATEPFPELSSLGPEVEEVLNAHFALHEMTSDHTDFILDWLARPSTQW